MDCEGGVKRRWRGADVDVVLTLRRHLAAKRGRRSLCWQAARDDTSRRIVELVQRRADAGGHS